MPDAKTERPEDIPTRLKRVFTEAVDRTKNWRAERYLGKDSNLTAVFALGKAAGGMLETAGRRIRSVKRAIAVTNDENKAALEGMRVGGREVEIFCSAHPIPDERSFQAGEMLLREAANLDGERRALILLSGGGSAMAEVAARELEPADIIQINELLLKCGAAIKEINTVRRALSDFKGGGWGRAFKCQWECLITSDVLDDSAENIASGPLADNPTGNRDAKKVLEKYALWRRVSGRARRRLEKLAPERPSLPRNRCKIVVSNRKTLEHMKEQALLLGHDFAKPEIKEEAVIGEAREAAREMVREAALKQAGHPGAKLPTVRLSGGETTVTVKGNGKGGRNQELALAFCIEAERGLKPPWYLLSAGTDGIDGPTDAAGAIVSHRTLTKIRSNGIDPQKELDDNNSYIALKAAGDSFKSGPTGTNVADIQILYLDSD